MLLRFVGLLSIYVVLTVYFIMAFLLNSLGYAVNYIFTI